MPISRMQNPRQLYGLGSFVKKITRPLKKVFKSKIGKAALLGLGAYGMGGGFGGFGGGGGGFGSLFGGAKNFLFGNVGGPANMYGKPGLFSKIGGMFGKGAIGKGAMALGLGGGLASMMAKGEDEEEADYKDRIRSMTPYLKRYYTQANPTASDEEVEQFISDNTVEYSKDGGLIGYQQGGPVDEGVIEDQETVTEDVETPTGMERLQETLTEVAKVLYRATPVGHAMFTYDEAKKLYEGLPDISKEMIHRIGKTLAGAFLGLTPIGAATAGAKGLATLLKGGIGQEEAQDLLGHREKRTRKADKQDRVGDLIDQGTSFEEAVDLTTLGQRQGAAGGGLMNLGGYEKDYRMGGYVPLGKKERKDDVPARLSKNEFVFTADAVKAAGGGSVDKGAQKMYDTMKRLENRIA